MHFALYQQARELAGNEASQTAAIFYSQSVKSAEKRGTASTLAALTRARSSKSRSATPSSLRWALRLGVSVTPGNARDCDGFLPLLKDVRRALVFLKRPVADGSYSCDETWAAAVRAGKGDLEIVKCSDVAKGFVVLPKHWIVEQTFGWLSRYRRVAKDFENRTRTTWTEQAAIPKPFHPLVTP